MRGSTVLAECLPSRLRFVPMLIKTANVINPAIGTSFESLEEDYEFYNLYSWEVGFGVQYVKSRLNVHQKKCVCACAVSNRQQLILSKSLCGMIQSVFVIYVVCVTLD